MKRKEFYALGIMSGTSLDGLDFSLIRSDGLNYVKIIKNEYYKFSLKIREELSSLIKFSDLNRAIGSCDIFKKLIITLAIMLIKNSEFLF